MNTPTNDGGPAFPAPLAFSPEGGAHIAPQFFADSEGMSLRDYFAANADPFGGDLNDALIQAVAGRQEPDWRTQPLAYMQWLAEATVKWKLMQADAMLAARKLNTTSK